MKPGIDYIGAAVGIFLLNEKEELLLLKRSQNAKNERGHWEAPGGAMEFGETLEAAARREFREELSAEIEIMNQLPAEDHIIPSDKQHWVATTFVAKLKKGGVPKIMEPHKFDAMGWFPLDSPAQPLSIITELNIKRYRKLKGLK